MLDFALYATVDRDPMLGLPSLTQQPAGSLADWGLVHLLLAADAQRLTGTLRLLDSKSASREWRLLLEDGEVTAGAFGHRGLGLLAELLPLCARTCGDYRFVSDRDLLGVGHDVLRGRVDPYMLAALASRGLTPHPRGWVELDALAGMTLWVVPGQSLVRFGLTRDEWNFVQDAKRNPGSLEDLLSRGLLAVTRSRYLVSLLLLTGVLAAAQEGVRALGPGPLCSMPVPKRARGERGELASALREMLAYGEAQPEQEELPRAQLLALPGVEGYGPRFEADRHLRHAEQLLQGQRFLEALAYAEAAIRVDPLAADPLAVKAYVLWRLCADPMQPGTEPLELLERALRIDEHCERAHRVRAQLLRALGREDEAFSHFVRGSTPDAEAGPRRLSSEGLWHRLRRSIPPFRRAG